MNLLTHLVLGAYVKRGNVLYPFRYLTEKQIRDILWVPEDERDFEIIEY